MYRTCQPPIGYDIEGDTTDDDKVDKQDTEDECFIDDSLPVPKPCQILIGHESEDIESDETDYSTDDKQDTDDEDFIDYS